MKIHDKKKYFDVSDQILSWLLIPMLLIETSDPDEKLIVREIFEWGSLDKSWLIKKAQNASSWTEEHFDHLIDKLESKQLLVKNLKENEDSEEKDQYSINYSQYIFKLKINELWKLA